jgi:hypothetical protein
VPKTLKKQENERKNSCGCRLKRGLEGWYIYFSNWLTCGYSILGKWGNKKL